MEALFSFQFEFSEYYDPPLVYSYRNETTVPKLTH